MVGFMVNEALLVVDVQTDVLATCIRRDETVANINALVSRAREAGIPVIWVRHSDEGLPLGSPGWQLAAEFTVADGEPVVEKLFGDSFAETDLADRLKEVGANAIVLCGAQTDACIRSTFYGALYRGYPTTLVTDAHTTEDLRPFGAKFTPVDSINVLNLQAEWTRLPDASGSAQTTAEWLSASDH